MEYASQHDVIGCELRSIKVLKLNSHKTAVDLYLRPHGPTARQADDFIFQDGCAVYETMKLESAKGSKVIVKKFLLIFLFVSLFNAHKAS